MGRERLASSGRDAARAALSGMLGSVAFSLEMWLDLRLVRYRFDDFTLLGRPFSSDARLWCPLGAGLHLLNGAVFGMAYARVRRFLPGPGWLRGVLYAEGLNLLLWPLMLLVDRYHPARRTGVLAPAWSLANYAVNVLRHLAYGAVLGYAYESRGE